MQTPLKAIIFSDPLGFFDFWRNHEPCTFFWPSMQSEIASVQDLSYYW